MKILLEAICVVQGSMDCGIISERIYDPTQKKEILGIVTFSRNLGTQFSAEKKLPSFYIKREHFSAIWNSPAVTYNIEYMMPVEDPPKDPPPVEITDYQIFLNGELVEF